MSETEYDYDGPSILEIDGEWYFVTESYLDGDGELIDGCDELQGPYKTKDEAKTAAMKWAP